MTTKTVFLFDELTRRLTGVYEAQESPEEPGQWITPTHSTFVVPHLDDSGREPTGFHNVLNPEGTAWELVDNVIPTASSPVAEETQKTLSSLEFLDLFTEAEQLAVVTATMSVPAVKLWYDRLLAAGYITIADPRTDAGLDALVNAGLLTSARKAQIAEALL